MTDPAIRRHFRNYTNSQSLPSSDFELDVPKSLNRVDEVKESSKLTR